MINYLESKFIGHQKAALTQRSAQYEVDRFVAHKRKDLLHEQFKTVLRRPSVLVAIFGTGAAREMLKKQRKNGDSGSSVSFTQLAMLAARFF